MGDGQDHAFDMPGGGPEEAAITPPDTPPPPYWSTSRLAAVLERNRAGLLAISGVHGVAEGRTADGQESVRIDIDGDSVRPSLPPSIDGFPVEVVIVPGGFSARPISPSPGTPGFPRQ